MPKTIHCTSSAAAFLVCVSLALQACQRQFQPDTRSADEAAIHSAADRWSKAILAKDLDQTLSFYAEDAEYLPANRPIALTPVQRRQVWIEDYALSGFSSTEVTRKIEVARSGDLAYQSGTYVLTTLDNRRRPMQSTGKFIVVWKKQADGQWKAVADIDNADQ